MSVIYKLIQYCLDDSNIIESLRTRVMYKEYTDNGKFRCFLYHAEKSNRVIITEVPDISDDYRDKCRQELLKLALRGAITGIEYANKSQE